MTHAPNEPEERREDDSVMRELDDDELDDVAGGNASAADLTFGGTT